MNIEDTKYAFMDHVTYLHGYPCVYWAPVYAGGLVRPLVTTLADPRRLDVLFT